MANVKQAKAPPMRRRTTTATTTTAPTGVAPVHLTTQIPLPKRPEDDEDLARKEGNIRVDGTLGVYLAKWRDPPGRTPKDSG